jgi:MinD-like ATPase involved in chromosome partitioning or flagellar assembly
MGANYDRLFQPPEGGELPDEAAAQPDFDIDAGFDIASPAAAAPTPAGPAKSTGQAAPPMPVDWNDHRPPARPESPRPPMLVNPEAPRRPMPVDYDRLFEASEGDQIHGDAAESAFDLNSVFDMTSPAAGPPMPTSPPEPTSGPSVPTSPPMPTSGPPMPTSPPEPNGHAPRPKAPPQPSRHARQGPPDPAQAPRAHGAPSSHSHRADAKPIRGNGAPGRTPPPRPRTEPPAPAPSGGSMRPPPPAQQAPTPTPVAGASQIGVKPAKKSSAGVISRRGWRRWLHKLTRINVGLSRDEKYELDLNNRIRRNPRGSYQIAILGLKGGVGKTTVTVALGSAFAQVRRDRILAFDADASCGNLGDRAGRQSAATIADLLADRDLTHYNNVRTHTSSNAVNLEVLPAENYSTARRAFSEADWHYASDAVSRFYNLVLADCGAGLFDPATRGVLSTACAVVIVTNASIDGARQAEVTIDWLRNNGHQDLLRRACVVINHVSPGETNMAAADLVRHFQQRVQAGRVVVLPWDKYIATGTEIQFTLLDPAYRRKILELAAALSDDFDRGERR